MREEDAAMAEAVCNTSPIQYLHQVGLLEILPTLYCRVVLPRAVMDELDLGRLRGVDLPETTGLSWMDVIDVDSKMVRQSRGIHRGEAEAIALAKSRDGATLILDDLAARSYARATGLSVTGTLGILARAKREGLVDCLGPVVEALCDAGFRLAKATRSDFLKLVGE